jgi:hypothetical protein
MSTPSQSIRGLARRLLDLETASIATTDAPTHAAVRVCDKLRICLTRLAGADGFTALLRRALLLAQADSPSLQNVKVGPGGRVEGFEEVAANAGNDAIEASVAITAHLLGLLTVFIGESLMLRLVRATWPDVSLDEPVE